MIRLIREQKPGGTPREWVYIQIGNVAGDMLESGQYHIYRGVLKIRWGKLAGNVRCNIR